MECATVTTLSEENILAANRQKRLENIFMNLGAHVLRFENGDLEYEEREKARKELRETPDVIKESIEAFKKLIKEQKNLNYPVDDRNLQIFLRPCKYYPESALDKLKCFYKFRYKHPKYCVDLRPSCESKAFLESIFTILPYRNTNGERVLVIEAGKKWNPKNCNLTEIFRSVMIILETAVEEPKTQVHGVQVIMDMDGLSMQHVWQFTPSFAKHVVDWTQDCIPIRLKGIHVVNQPYIFNMLFAIFKQFLNDKLQKRIKFHGSNFETLHSVISPSILPKHLGGDLDIPFDQGKELHNYMLKYDSEFADKLDFGYTKDPDKK